MTWKDEQGCESTTKRLRKEKKMNGARDLPDFSGVKFSQRHAGTACDSYVELSTSSSSKDPFASLLRQ